MLIRYVKAIADPEREGSGVEVTGIVYGKGSLDNPREMYMPHAQFVRQYPNGRIERGWADHPVWKMTDIVADDIPCEQRAVLLTAALADI